MIGIYKITSPSKRVYIGQSIDIEKRFSHYKRLRCKSQIKLYNSLKKHGTEKHKFEILCQCEISELNEKERYYQELFSAIGLKGLNCSLVKTNQKSGLMNEESKRKMSIAQTGKKLSIYTRLKMSESSKGIAKPKRSIEHCEKISISKIGNKNMLGKKHSEETKLKISNSKKGSKLSELHVFKMKKEIINTVTGEIHYGVNSVALILKCKSSGLNHKLNGISKNNTIYKYK